MTYSSVEHSSLTKSIIIFQYILYKCLFATFIVRCNATAIVYYNLRAHARVWWKSYIIAIFRYFVTIILYCKTIHPVIFFSTTYIFYSIYFNIQYNIEMIFAINTFFGCWTFFHGIAPPVSSILLLLYLKKTTPRTSMISILFRKKNLQQNKGIL